MHPLQMTFSKPGILLSVYERRTLKFDMKRRRQARCIPSTFPYLPTLVQAGILSGLSHEHIVEMRDFYKWDLAYCLAMEHMEGGELCEDIIRRVFYSEACARRVSEEKKAPEPPVQSFRPRLSTAACRWTAPNGMCRALRFHTTDVSQCP